MRRGTLKGEPDKAAENLQWSGPLFQAEIGCDAWGSQEIDRNQD
jgi:hypothetical protein